MDGEAGGGTRGSGAWRGGLLRRCASKVEDGDRWAGGCGEASVERTRQVGIIHDQDEMQTRCGLGGRCRRVCPRGVSCGGRGLAQGDSAWTGGDVDCDGEDCQRDQQEACVHDALASVSVPRLRWWPIGRQARAPIGHASRAVRQHHPRGPDSRFDGGPARWSPTAARTRCRGAQGWPADDPACIEPRAHFERLGGRMNCAKSHSSASEQRGFGAAVVAVAERA